MLEVRPACASDEVPLRELDQATWTTLSSPAPAPPPGRPFFGNQCRLENVLVAELDGEVSGYVTLGRATELRASDHVVHVLGLAVAESAQGRGVGRALVHAAAAEARARGARRLTLRVLGHNTRARHLYERCGFVVEGILKGEFVLDGREVDDVLMALAL